VIVFVALDDVEGKPTPVPAWTPQTDDDRRVSEYATQVMALSKGIEQTVARYREAERGAAAGMGPGNDKAAS
jgi:acyl-CoA hydrolase